MMESKEQAFSAQIFRARALGPSGLLVLNVSGRGDKDVEHVRRALEARERPARRRAPARRKGR